MNIQDMMKQAKLMQQRMQEMQEKLGLQEVEGQSGGGMVVVRMTCRGEVRKVSIQPDALGDREVLEDLIMAAYNMARELADTTLAGETRKMMEGLGLPGDTKLPGT